MLGRNPHQVNAKRKTPCPAIPRIGGSKSSPHSGVRRPLPFHQRKNHAIPTTETRAVARGMGSGKCRFDGGRWVINSMGRSPNATCRVCRRIFCRSRVCISSTSPGFFKSILPSRVSKVVERDLRAVYGPVAGNSHYHRPNTAVAEQTCPPCLSLPARLSRPYGSFFYRRCAAGTRRGDSPHFHG